MIAPIYPGSRVQMNIGEGLHSNDDLNLMQALAESRLWDMFASSYASSDDGRSNQGLGSPHVGGDAQVMWAIQAAPIRDEFAANTINLEPGVLMMFPTGSTFEGAGGFYSGGGALAYCVRSGEFTATFATGDATNPRIDILAAKIERVSNDVADNESRAYKASASVASVVTTFVKRSKLKLTLLVVAGTPAGSPVAPALPAGYARLAEVYMPATFSSTIDYNNIRDYRNPLGWHTETMFLSGTSGDRPSGDVSQAGGWAYNAAQLLGCVTPGATLQITPRPRARFGARLHSIVMSGKLGHCSVYAQRVLADPTVTTGFGLTLIKDISSSFNAAPGQIGKWYASSHSTPIWGNGRPSGIAALRPGTVYSEGEIFALTIAAGASVADYVKMIQFNWNTL